MVFNGFCHPSIFRRFHDLPGPHGKQHPLGSWKVEGGRWKVWWWGLMDNVETLRTLGGSLLPRWDGEIDVSGKVLLRLIVGSQ